MWFIVARLRRCPAGGTGQPKAVCGGPRTASRPWDDEPHRPFARSLPRTTTNRPHRSGSLHLGISLLRLFWRLGHKPPALPAEIAGWEATLSKFVHVLFYALIIVIPITGWLMVSAYPEAPPVSFFGLFNFDLPFGKSKALSGIGHEGHEILTYALYGIVALHIIGALKHQFADRMPFLRRMWPN